jgi:hypothetical protein
MLGDEGAWERAFAQGRAMSAEVATAYALSEESPSERLPAGGERDNPLTTDPLNAWCELRSPSQQVGKGQPRTTELIVEPEIEIVQRNGITAKRARHPLMS